MNLKLQCFLVFVLVFFRLLGKNVLYIRALCRSRREQSYFLIFENYCRDFSVEFVKFIELVKEDKITDCHRIFFLLEGGSQFKNGMLWW